MLSVAMLPMSRGVISSSSSSNNNNNNNNNKATYLVTSLRCSHETRMP